MDVISIAFVGIIVLSTATLVVYLVGKWRSDSAAAYERRMAAEQSYDAAIIKAAKVLVVGDIAYVTRGVNRNNEIIYDSLTINANGTPITADVIDGERVTLHRIASKLVDDSISKNGLNGVQLLTANQWEAMGNTREAHGQALEYLKALGVYKIQGGKADSQGSFVEKGKTLQMLLLDMAVYALPLATGQPIKKSP